MIIPVFLLNGLDVEVSKVAATYLNLRAAYGRSTKSSDKEICSRLKMNKRTWSKQKVELKRKNLIWILSDGTMKLREQGDETIEVEDDETGFMDYKRFQAIVLQFKNERRMISIVLTFLADKPQLVYNARTLGQYKLQFIKEIAAKKYRGGFFNNDIKNIFHLASTNAATKLINSLGEYIRKAPQECAILTSTPYIFANTGYESNNVFVKFFHRCIEGLQEFEEYYSANIWGGFYNDFLMWLERYKPENWLKAGEQVQVAFCVGEEFDIAEMKYIPLKRFNYITNKWERTNKITYLKINKHKRMWQGYVQHTLTMVKYNIDDEQVGDRPVSRGLYKSIQHLYSGGVG